MKRFIVIASIVGMLVPMGLKSQKVYKDGDKVILDMTVESGMPAGAVTSESKTSLYNAESVTPTRTGPMININGAKNDGLHPLNATVYQKLEISNFDITVLRWDIAFNYCKNAAGGNWRLPTIKELTAVFLFRKALDQLLDVKLSKNYPYWSATEFAASQAFSYRTTDGLITRAGINNKNSTGVNTRCVREIKDL